MISQGISAPSTAFVDSACGRSGTGIVTGVAPIASTTALPVGPGTRSFLPLRVRRRPHQLRGHLERLAGMDVQ